VGIFKKVTDALGEDGLNLVKATGQQFFAPATYAPPADVIPSGPAHVAVPPPPPTGPMVWAPPPPASITPPVTHPAGDVVDGLQKLGEMFQAGLLTEAEFSQAKSRLLG
jgi:hypothetical protein